jgi:hypothetical protein
MRIHQVRVVVAADRLAAAVAVAAVAVGSFATVFRQAF